MRLRTIRDIIDREIFSIGLKATGRNTNPKTYQLTNVETLQNAINELDKLGIFDTTIEELKNPTGARL